MPLRDPLSYQLYSSRDFPPLEAQLRTIADAGFTNVETYGAFYDDVETARQLFDRYGLTAPERPFRARHGREAAGQGARDRPHARHHDGRLPLSRPRGAPGRCRRLGRHRRAARQGRRLVPRQRAAARLAQSRFRVRARLPDGSLPIEHLLTDGVLWEADIAWIIRGKADPRPWIERYRGRMPLVHVKDIAPAGREGGRGRLGRRRHRHRAVGRALAPLRRRRVPRR